MFSYDLPCLFTHVCVIFVIFTTQQLARIKDILTNHSGKDVKISHHQPTSACIQSTPPLRLLRTCQLSSVHVVHEWKAMINRSNTAY